jgi:hypothetical protein
MLLDYVPKLMGIQVNSNYFATSQLKNIFFPVADSGFAYATVQSSTFWIKLGF